MKLSHRMFLLLTATIVLVWLIYNVFFRIREAFGSSTLDMLYYFDTDTVTKRQKGVYTVERFPDNVTAINKIKFFTRINSGGEDIPKTYPTEISGDTIDTGGTSVQFRSPSFNSKGQYKGFLSIHSNPTRFRSMNTKNSIGLPCNITQQKTIMGTSTMPGSSVLQVSGISNANFNNPRKKSKYGNNVMMKINYELSK